MPDWSKIPGSPWTIGWGHTGIDVHPGQKIDEDKADDLLEADLSFFESNVEALLPEGVTSNYFSACVSLAYNIGLTAFAKSTVLRKFDDHDMIGAAEAFKMWNKSGGKVLKGLKTRRAKESELFLTPIVDGDNA